MKQHRKSKLILQAKFYIEKYEIEMDLKSLESYVPCGRGVHIHLTVVAAGSSNHQSPIGLLWTTFA